MNPGTLLIVDDEPLILRNLKITLDDCASKIFTAQNGLEALDVLKDKTIHCVICDINMPKLNGVELIKRLRSKNNDVPVIFYTGHGNRELMIEVAKYGAFDFLDKPNLDGLEEVVKRGLQLGFIKKDADQDQNVFESEYTKLLKEII
jgi:two-component system response regulator AtoC